MNERNFCYNCNEAVLERVEAISCPKCGNTDLIPNPFEMYEGEAIGSPEKDVGTPFQPEKKAGEWILENEPIFVEEIEEEIKEEKPQLELDEDAVTALTIQKFGFLTGLAGTGKTTLITEVSRRNPRLFELCATTGIAAVNLNSKTMHSTLKFFDLKSLENAWREQLLHMNLRKVRARANNLLVDEASMLGAEQLDFIMNAIEEINQDGTGKELGLWLSGDLCQLPPVKMKFVFKSDYWPLFEANTVRLTKVWRQDNLKFMDGINLIRANKGVEAMKLFEECGVTFTKQVNDNFEGTTLIPNNNDVDSYNEKRLREVVGSTLRSQAIRKGKEAPEWDKLIPYELRLKIGAYVMILSNDIPDFKYVNGDCGWIRDYDKDDDAFLIELKRTGNIVRIKPIKRENFTNKEPEPYMFTKTFSPYNDYKTGDWVIGYVQYHPIRLAYASTIHKSQGLSLDMVQIDTNPKFFTYDSMGYVSISRARTPEGLVLVGDPVNIGRKMSMNREVMKYV